MTNQMFNDPLIDGHEVQAEFYAEIEAEANSALPPRCLLCGEFACECSTFGSIETVVIKNLSDGMVLVDINLSAEDLEEDLERAFVVDGKIAVINGKKTRKLWDEGTAKRVIKIVRSLIPQAQSELSIQHAEMVFKLAIKKALKR